MTEDEDLPTAAVRRRLENPPYGWTYLEDPEYGKRSSNTREELVQRQDAEDLLKYIRGRLRDVLDKCDIPEQGDVITEISKLEDEIREMTENSTSGDKK